MIRHAARFDLMIKDSISYGFILGFYTLPRKCVSNGGRGLKKKLKKAGN